MAKECRDMRELREKVAKHYGRQMVQFALSLPLPEPKVVALHSLCWATKERNDEAAN
jgi:hypothetical protein